MTLCCCEYCKPDQIVGSLSSRAVAGRSRDLSRRKQNSRRVCSLIAVAHARLRHPPNQLDHSLGDRRGARPKRQARPFREHRVCIERMLDPLETRRQRQLRRRRRERRRCQEYRGADRAISIVVNWRRRLRQNLALGNTLRDCGCVRIFHQTGQMHVIEGEHDLQRHRDQRQHNAVPLMSSNPAHPQRTRRATTRPRAFVAC